MAIRTILFLMISISAFASIAQNLVPNPSFEDHLPTDLQTFTDDYQFAATMKNWRILNSQARICDCSYKMTEDDHYFRTCRLDRVKPIHGCAMMELSYGANCLDWEHETRGCSSYLGAKLTKPLEVGKTYEIAFWINVLKPDDPAFVKNIGFALFKDNVRNKNGGLLDCSSFHLDSIEYETWVQVKWNIKPLCRLRFLVLGVFRGNEGPPVHSLPNYNVFYLDNVTVRELNETEAPGSAAIPFCHCSDSAEPDSLFEVEGVHCYFDPGQSLLNAAALASLDSFALRAKDNPRATFLVTGHTDSTGENHHALAGARVAAVLQYLEEKHRIPRLRFSNYAMGKSMPLASNRTVQGRQFNRRVSIAQLDVPAENVVYRYFLEAVFNDDKAAAYKAINTWLSIAPNHKEIWMLFDPRTNALKQDERWKNVIARVKSGYHVFKKPLLAFKLDSLWAEDQKARTLSYYIENLNTYFAKMDSQNVRLDVVFKESINNGYCADTVHYKGLIDLIGENNWPKISEVGERAAKAAFLIIDHQQDTAILARFLPILEESCQEGEAQWLYYATMYDRLQVMLGKPQRYGTQFKPMATKPGKMELFPLENEAKVNEWREKLGLPPILPPNK